MKLNFVSALAILSLTACSQNSSSETASIDGWCFHNGIIHTADDANPQIEAVAVIDGEIVHAGAETDDWCPEGAMDYNLNGQAMYPGLTDAHAHLIGIGQREIELDLSGVSSVKELQDAVRDAADGLPAGETIYGRGWIETHWPEGRFPNRGDLDSVTDIHPVILTRADGHASVVNSLALSLSGIDGDTEDPFGGAVNKDEAGQPTGMLIDTAMEKVSDLIPEADEALRARAYRLGSDVYISRGWTNVHSMSVDPGDIDLINRLANEGDIKLRVYNAIGLPERQASKKVDDMGGGMSKESTYVTTRAVKLYADGALGSRGAALLAPYSDDPTNHGLMTLDRPRALATFQTALRNGIQVNTHAIGDKGNKEVLDWYEEAFNSVPKGEWAVSEPRWRIEHSQILDVEDIERFKALGVIPSMQPSHAIGDLHFAVDRLGPDRLAGAYAWRALIDTGTIIAGGSDAPVEVGDPRIEFHASMNRTDLAGYANENWNLEQRVSPQEALKMFTLWPAYAAFQEDSLGSIEVGKRADFSVFDRDMLDPNILPMDTNPVMTMVDGQIVWSR